MRLIAEARIKTDVVDTTVLARLYACGFLPEVWVPDQRTLALRRQVTRRNQIVRQRARLKTIIQSILHAHLVPPCPHADLLGPTGRAWLLGQALPPDEQDAVARHLREHDRLSEDLRVVEREIARDALASADTKRLMTVPGIDMVVATGLLAAIGPVVRFAGPDKLVAYLGLNPRGRQSGDGRPRYGRITKQGRTYARTMLIEAAWQAVRRPRPLRAFYQRIAGRLGKHIVGPSTKAWRCRRGPTGWKLGLHLGERDVRVPRHGAQDQRRMRLDPPRSPAAAPSAGDAYSLGRGGLGGRDGGARQHLRQGAPLGARRQRGARAQAIGPSRGGRTTKIHLLADLLGRPAVVHLTPGNASDVKTAPVVLAAAPGRLKRLIADRGYDADYLRCDLKTDGTTPVIPSTRSRKRPIRHDKRRYRDRWRIEAAFCRLKDFRP